MFNPAPRRHRRLPTGTMVSYAEVKSYLSKREIPQLFESLMAGLMYHRPENHIGYLQSCLDEVKANSDTKVQWSTFVNAKKRKSKEILPPLTPKKQDSFSSSWSDNSRQSTPLPPISARTRTRIEQQDFRNTYILYHNPPPILAKPKVPVISVLGGLGTKIDELCEKVVRRLRGVVHISTCSMLKTRMTIEGFYRITSVPACAVVDSVLQAMSMVQSADALLVAGFPRNRGDIEEYKSRKVRMDGVVLVDFEEEALRHFIEHEVASGVVRTSEIEAELERFKQDIISVAEYYDAKELLTVVMGDQDTEEIVEDLILAIDKIIETKKSITDEEIIEGKKTEGCISPCRAILPSPDRLERPSTVEIRDATEEDLKSIEAESNSSKSKENLEDDVDEVQKTNSEKSEEESNKSEVKNGEQISENEAKVEVNENEKAENVSDKESPVENENVEEAINSESEKATENIDEKENLENGKSDASEIVAADGIKEDDNSIKDEPTKSDLNNNSSEASGISVKEDNLESNKDDAEEKSEKTENEASVKDNASDDVKQPSEDNDETALAAETQNIPLVFSFENIYADPDDIRNLIANDLEMCFINFDGLVRKEENDDEELDNDEAMKMLKSILQKDAVSYSNGFFVYKLPFSLLNESFIEQLLILGNLNFVCKVRENKSDSLSESKDIEENKLFNSPFSEKIRIIFVTEDNVISELREALREIIENKNNVSKATEAENKIINEMNNDSNNGVTDGDAVEMNESDDKEKKVTSLENENANEEIDVDQEKEENVLEEKSVEQEIDEKEEVPQDMTEDSTGKDVEDLVTDTLNEGSKLPESFINEDNPAEAEVDDTHSQASTLPSTADETQRERAVLERQTGVEMEAENEENEEGDKSSKTRASLIRQGTYSADEMKNEDKTEEMNEINDKEASEEINEEDSSAKIETEKTSECENENIDSTNKIDETEPEQGNSEDEKNQSEKRAEEDVLSNDKPEVKNEENEIEENSSKHETQQSNEILQDDVNPEIQDNKSAENTEKDESVPEDEKNLEQLDSTDINANEGITEEGRNSSAENADVIVNDKEDEGEEKNETESGKDEQLKEETSNSEEKCNSADNENVSSDEQSNKEKSEHCSETHSESNEKHLENSNENSKPKNGECSESNELLKSEKESSLNEEEKSEHSHTLSKGKENNEENNSTSKQESENNAEDKDDEKAKSDELSVEIQKAVYNDSDSNDENVTIETKAEVHAVDCASPAASESSKSKTAEEENEKSNTGDEDNENVADVKDDSSSDKNKLNEMKNESVNENNNDSETLEIRDSIDSERLSGKRQERSGSGILGESREPDPAEIEEPQERSSSSSRGEL